MDLDDYEDEDMFADEAIEVDDPEEKNKEGDATYDQLVGDLAKEQNKTLVVPKKRETKPRFKYTEYDLIGPKGLVALKKTFEDHQLTTDGKAPYSELNGIMEKMELWAHRLHPSIQFDDFLTKTEQLGKKRPVKTYMNKMRLGMDLHDEEDAVFEAKKKKESKRDQIVIIE